MCQRVSTAARHFFLPGTVTHFTLFLRNFTWFLHDFTQFLRFLRDFLSGTNFVLKMGWQTHLLTGVNCRDAGASKNYFICPFAKNHSTLHLELCCCHLIEPENLASLKSHSGHRSLLWRYKIIYLGTWFFIDHCKRRLMIDGREGVLLILPMFWATLHNERESRSDQVVAPLKAATPSCCGAGARGLLVVGLPSNPSRRRWTLGRTL